MKINSVVLNNIRSYTDEKIKFGSGTTLISGDIGCGKSSVLYAIDFALFGVRPGSKSDDLPGAALLRHGANTGHVILDFSIDGKSVKIKRTLVRKNTTVSQGAGSVTINGVIKDLTATEIKSDILVLLGYPENLLKKNKSLLFRYTVYTPQEQMKEIIFEKVEDRLDTLRNVFGMDKYKRISVNASLFSLELRRTKSRFEGVFLDLEQKQEELKVAVLEKELVEKNVEISKKDFEKINLSYLEKKEGLLTLKNKIDELLAIKTKRDVLKKSAEMSEKRSVEIKNELKILRDKLLKTDEKTLRLRLGILEKEIVLLDSKKEELKKIQLDVRELEGKLRECDTRKKTANELIEKISSLDSCPTCGQGVDVTYKQSICDVEGKKITNFDKILTIHKKNILEKEEIVKKLTLEIDAIRVKEKEKITILHELKGLDDVLKNMSLKEDEHQKMIDETQKTLQEIAGFVVLLKEFDVVRALYVKGEQEIEKLRVGLIEAKSVSSKFEQAMVDVKKRIVSIEKEVAIKLKAKKDCLIVSDYENWISYTFIPLLDTIEKHMMAVIQQEFNALFSTWFSVLVEDENLSCTIDDKFSPLVMQNGFEVSYNFLSGGEKTSIALAYRLALNKIINSLSETIRTKDLLILDEPTDGFSTEQLDRVRDVLDELKLKQILIVSHEAKMADFVDNVIRFRKSGHVSGIC
ncbi:AAA family ATPase [archaeon]|nr:AAA family ATPase [archaeon]